VEGFADTFAALFRQVYRDMAAGARHPDSAWASFEDGHKEMQLCDAILQSAREGCWVSMPA
jgi:predicted dehydrogenase